MIELLVPCGFDTLEYSWVKATIGIYMLADYSMAKKRQQGHQTQEQHQRDPSAQVQLPQVGRHVVLHPQFFQHHPLGYEAFGRGGGGGKS
jgi:hypothetical protein